MALTRRSLLLSSLAAGTFPRLALGQSGTGSTAPEFLIVVLAEGGWDVTFVFDDKLSVDTIQGPEVDEDAGNPEDREERQTFGGISIVANPVKRPNVSAFFEAWHDRCCLVNGVWMGSIAHDPCRFRILTGTQDGSRPDLASIVGYKLGTELPLGSVDLSGWSMNGPLAASAGRVGANSQILPLVDPTVTFSSTERIGRPYPLYSPTTADRDAVAAYMKARTAALKDHFGGLPVSDDRISDLEISLDRAGRFRDQGLAIVDSLVLGQSATLSTQTEMAASLLADGLCRTVTIDSRKEWDTHDTNVLQHGFFDGLFIGLSVLMDALQARQILDRTLIMVCSEMTRTPALNGAAGKDHWGHTSTLLIGAGVRGSTLIGGTDDRLESLPVDYDTGETAGASKVSKYENLAAGVLELFDVDPQEWLPGVEPFRAIKA